MPIQLTLTSVFTIGIPSFVLALEPNRERVKGDFLRNVISKAVPGAVTIVFNVLVVSAAAFLLDIPQQQISTMCVMLTGFTGFLLVFRICLPFNPLRIALFAVIVGGFTLCCLFPAQPVFPRASALDAADRAADLRGGRVCGAQRNAVSV